MSDKGFSWRVWEQRVSGKNEEGQPTYTPEFSWSHGTRAEFVNTFQLAISEWLPHIWRDVMQKQGLRVFEDRKSGRHNDAARRAQAFAALKHYAFHLVAKTLPQLPEVKNIYFALASLVRVASADALAALAAAKSAAVVHEAAACTATVQSDYAAQIQTKRSHTATCARPERHNCLVMVVGYKPYYTEPVWLL